MSPARDETYDFVIVGSGGASTCASLPCKTLGKRTLIVERRAAIEAAIRRTFGRQVLSLSARAIAPPQRGSMDTQVFPPKIGVPTPEGGRPPCELEHRKSLQEIEAPARGTPKIVARTGETIPVGTILTGIG